MDFRAFISGLPKAELHMHLEGSLEPAMAADLARRNNVPIPEPLRSSYEFTDLPSFLKIFYQASQVIITERDFYDLTLAYLRRAHTDNVVHAEMFLGPQNFVEQGTGIAVIMNGVLSAIADAERDWGITAGLLVSVQRHRPEEEAFRLLESVMPWGHRILGFGMGGDERGNPASKFAGFFRECRQRGFHVTAHAGEEGPAAPIRDALDVLGLERIDHGIASMADPSLVEDLAARQVPLTVCPVSNLKVNTVPSLAAHPLPAMLEAGLRVTVNSDDPAYFDAYMNDALWQSCTEMKLSMQDAITVVRNGFLSSFMDADSVKKWLTAVDAYCARFG